MAIHNVKQGIQETCRLVEGTQTMMVKDCLMLLVCSTCKACKLPLAQQKLHDVLPSSWPRVIPPTYAHVHMYITNVIIVTSSRVAKTNTITSIFCMAT